MWVFFMIGYDLYCPLNKMFPLIKIRSVAALGAFLMWLKVFYWMRLFRNSGYYITLILNTIYDIRIFLAMVLLIIIAFSNTMYLCQLNSAAGDVVAQNYGSPIIDAFISQYMLSLGEFNYGGFITSPDDGMEWFFFCFGTFLMMVVFMNMLIAIMGNTFNDVMDK